MTLHAYESRQLRSLLTLYHSGGAAEGMDLALSRMPAMVQRAFRGFINDSLSFYPPAEQEYGARLQSEYLWLADKIERRLPLTRAEGIRWKALQAEVRVREQQYLKRCIRLYPKPSSPTALPVYYSDSLGFRFATQG